MNNLAVKIVTVAIETITVHRSAIVHTTEARTREGTTMMGTEGHIATNRNKPTGKKETTVKNSVSRSEPAWEEEDPNLTEVEVASEAIVDHLMVNSEDVGKG